jgi:predicted dehydrogenase
MMPARLRSFCHFGKYRNIEVEDEVTAYLEYEGGATGVLITTTGEAPGTNRLEIAGDLGKAVIEDDQLSFWRLKVSELEFNRDYKGDFGKPECNKFTIPIEENSSGHRGITQNFVNAIRNGTSLIASGSEGMHALLLSNAMLLSTWEDKWIEFPFDEELYYDHLRKRINFPSK